jgi:phage tail sheath protein FI
MLEFEALFGKAKPTPFTAQTATDATTGLTSVTSIAPANAAGPNPDRLLYYAMSHYFRNGGGPCYVFSLGNYSAPIAKANFLSALNLLALEDEPTLIVMPDAVLLPAADYFEVAQAALALCDTLDDRFAILDVPGGDIAGFRNAIGTNHLRYGAAYHPYLQTSLNPYYVDSGVQVQGLPAAPPANGTFSSTFPSGASGITVSYTGANSATPKLQIAAGDGAQPLSFAITAGLPTLAIGNTATKTGAQIATAWNTWKGSNQPQGFDIKAAGDGSAQVQPTAAGPGADLAKQAAAPPPAQTMDDIKTAQTGLYNQIRDAMSRQRITLPPSAAIAGVYASVDRDRGVWKAPANVSLNAVVAPDTKITDAMQDGMNVDPTAGKSINAIRAFTGKGTLVWGARTLAGNDNEWRYVSVRRLFITIEENTRKASAFAVFEPNDATTWLKVRGMIESYLYSLWERGALAGAAPADAYFVNVGLGKTMTAQDVLEGRLIVEIGVAAVRPAEFIILRFMHKLQQS